MTGDPNTDLPPYKKFKHLYLGKGYDIVDINIDDGRGDCTFKTEDDEVEVSGSSQGFLELLSSMVKIKEEGEYKYVDVENYPAGNKQSFSENLELFEASDNNPVEKAVKRINNGSVEPPEGFDLIEGVYCSIDRDFRNKNLEYIINNYYVAIAIANSQTHNISKLTNKYQENANNTFRYNRYVRVVSKIFYSRYMDIAPDTGMKRWRHYCKNDLLHSGEQLSSNISHHRERARRIAKKNISTDGPIIELLSLEDGSSIGGLDPEMGMREMADEYASLSEAIKPLLKDLLVSMNTEIDRSEITGLHNIKQVLSESDFSFLGWSIEPQLRHGPSHSNIQIDEIERKVKIYDRDDSDPGIEKELSYGEVVNILNQIEDLAAALLHVFIHAEHKTTKRFLDSEEFKYHCSLHYSTNQI